MRRQIGLIITLSAAVYAIAQAEPRFDHLSQPPPVVGNWASIGRGPYAWHFSPLNQINTRTVERLGLAWSANIPTQDGLVGEPLIAGGTVYQSGPRGRIYANDLRTGRLLWAFAPHYHYGSGNIWSSYFAARFNRGLALWRNEVIIAVGDCRLIAVDRANGHQIWQAQACDPIQRESLAGPPSVGDGKVFMGMSGGDVGGRGFVNAFDARTGRQLWRFYTVPRKEYPKGSPPSDPAAMARAWQTWGKGYTPAGGAPWQSILYDPRTHFVLVGTGAPAEADPLKRGKNRGDELYTNSIVALDANTGKYVWHYEETPDDAWNYEATTPMVLADLVIGGKRRHLVMQAPKNGFFYVLDATTGTMLSAKNFVPVFWASHIDLKTGRPVQNPASHWYQKPGQWVFMEPDGPASGAHLWEAMAYSPTTGLVYIPAAIQSVWLRYDPKSFLDKVDIQNFYGSLHDSRLSAYGEMIAWDPLTQRARWRWRARSLSVGGVLTTAGNLVFAGTGSGKLLAFNANTGRILWSFKVGNSCIQGPPVTVESGAQQIIVVPSGSCSAGGAGRVVPLLFSKTNEVPQGPSRLLAFTLDGHATLPPPKRPIAFPKPPLAQFPASQAQRGEALYDSVGCEECHGAKAVAASGSVPDLREAPLETQRDFVGIVFGALSDKGMPNWAGVLTAADAQAIQAYVINQAWSAYKAGGRPDTTRLRP